MERIKPFEGQIGNPVKPPQLPTCMPSNKEPSFFELQFLSWILSNCPPRCTVHYSTLLFYHKRLNYKDHVIRHPCPVASLQVHLWGSWWETGGKEVMGNWREGNEVQYLLSSSLPAMSPSVSSVI